MTNRKVQYLAGICASLAFLFTGAILSWPSPALPKFKKGEVNAIISDAEWSWVVSVTVLGAIPGCYISQVLTEKLGRKKTIYASAVPGFIGAIIILFTRTPALFYVARILEGVSTGMIAVVTMVYITEIADAQTRGALGMLVQVMNNAGALLVYAAGPFISYTALNVLMLSIPVVYTVACCWLPESPYHYLKKGNVAAATKAYMFIQNAEDETLVLDQLDIMRTHVKESLENRSTYKELFTKKRYRKSLGIIAGLKILQYLTGILAIQSYLEIIFRQSTSISGPIASIVFGLVQLGSGILATIVSRRYGRRPLLLWSCLGVGISLSALGAHFYFLETHGTTGNALPLIAVNFFTILYASGVGNIPYLMQAELFPLHVKTVASSAATIMSCVLSFTVAKSYHTVSNSVGHYALFWMFATVAFIGLPFVYFCVPETKGKTLEEIQDSLEFNNLEVEKLNKLGMGQNEEI